MNEDQRVEKNEIKKKKKEITASSHFLYIF